MDQAAHNKIISFIWGIDMDSYRVEKKAAMKVLLPDDNAEVEPVPVAGVAERVHPNF